MGHREQYAVVPGKHVALKSVDPAYKGHHKSSDAAKEEIEENRKKLAELQVLLWAEKKHSLLIVLQARDAGGKDGHRQTCARRIQSTGHRRDRIQSPDRGGIVT